MAAFHSHCAAAQALAFEFLDSPFDGSDRGFFLIAVRKIDRVVEMDDDLLFEHFTAE